MELGLQAKGHSPFVAPKAGRRADRCHRDDAVDQNLGFGAERVPEVEPRDQQIRVRDEPVTEGYIEIRQRDGGKVVTVIEFLSPANKLGGQGQQKYIEKQTEVLQSDVSLVEIDLVRRGDRVLALPEYDIPLKNRADYLACVSPGWRRSRRELYVMPLRQGLATIPIPLRKNFSESHSVVFLVVVEVYKTLVDVLGERLSIQAFNLGFCPDVIDFWYLCESLCNARLPKLKLRYAKNDERGVEIRVIPRAASCLHSIIPFPYSLCGILIVPPPINSRTTASPGIIS